MKLKTLREALLESGLLSNERISKLNITSEQYLIEGYGPVKHPTEDNIERKYCNIEGFGPAYYNETDDEWIGKSEDNKGKVWNGWKSKDRKNEYNNLTNKNKNCYELDDKDYNKISKYVSQKLFNSDKSKDFISRIKSELSKAGMNKDDKDISLKLVKSGKISHIHTLKNPKYSAFHYTDDGDKNSTGDYVTIFDNQKWKPVITDKHDVAYQKYDDRYK